MDIVTTIKFLSFNMWLRPLFVVSSINGDQKEARYNKFVNTYLENYDIVLLQEVFGTWGKRMKEDAQKKGFKFVESGPKSKWRTFKFVDSGILLLSKLEIVESNIHDFKERGYGSDYLVRKGAIRVRVKTGEGRLIDVFTTHLQADYTTESTKKSEKEMYRNIQVAQLKELKQFMVHKKGISIVLAGDFNIDAYNEKRYQEMLDVLFGDEKDKIQILLQPEKEKEQEFQCETFPSIHQQIDHAFVSKSLTVLDAKVQPFDKCLSDHYGLEFTIKT